jgi:thiol-disulfide isomerase/thioredoxin
VQGRKGTIALAETVAQTVPAPPTSASASPSGVVKVYDFGAVWCPPCNLLAADLHADPSATAGLPLEPVDVDRPESWTLKDRYAVGGYPTLVAVDAAGGVVDRLLGYPGPEATRAWFTKLRAEVPLDVLAADALAGKVPPADAAAAARRLAEAERTDAAKALFATAADTVDLHIARLTVDETAAADAAWLFDHHAPAGDWVYAALEAAPTRWMDAVALVPSVSPVVGADLLGSAAEHAPADTAKVLQLSALALLRSAQTGDPAHDRGHYTYLADLLADTGDVPGALALLDRAATTFPDEFTFPFSAARLLVDQKRFAEADAKARLALQKAWGDQRLRAVQVLAEALDGEGKRPEALAVLDAELAAAARPDPAVKVRTHRYLAQVEALRKAIAEKK